MNMIPKYGHLVFVSLFFLNSVLLSEPIEIVIDIFDENPNKLGISTYTLRRDQLKNSASLAEVISAHSLAHTRKNGPAGQQSSISIRNNLSYHTLILIDGFVVQDPTTPSNGFDLSTLNPELIESITIVNSNMSAFYGSQALGGAILITTRTKLKGFNNALSISAGNRFYQTNFLHTQSLANWNIWAQISQKDHFNQSVVTTTPNVTEKDRHYRQALNLGAHYQGSINQIWLKYFAHFDKTDLDQDPTTPLADDPNYHSKSHNHNWQFKWLQELNSKKLIHEFKTQYFMTKRKYQDLVDTNRPTQYFFADFTSKDLMIDDKWTLNTTFNPNSKLINSLGFSYQHQTADIASTFAMSGSEFSESVKDKKINNSAIYTHHELNYDYLTLSAAGRHDFNSDNKFTSYQLTSHLKKVLFSLIQSELRLLHATGFKRPSLYQLYSNYGNQDLKMEENHSQEIGVNFSNLDQNMTLSTNYFWHQYRNLIDFVDGTYQNFSKVKIAGLETSGSYRIHKTTFTLQNLNSKAIDQTNGQQLSNRPKQKIIASISQDWGITKSQISFHKISPNRNYQIDFKQDLKISQKLDSYAAIYNINNNKKPWIAGYSRSLRFVELGIEYKF